MEENPDLKPPRRRRPFDIEEAWYWLDARPYLIVPFVLLGIPALASAAVGWVNARGDSLLTWPVLAAHYGVFLAIFTPIALASARSKGWKVDEPLMQFWLVGPAATIMLGGLAYGVYRFPIREGLLPETALEWNWVQRAGYFFALMIAASLVVGFLKVFWAGLTRR